MGCAEALKICALLGGSSEEIQGQNELGLVAELSQGDCVGI